MTRIPRSLRHDGKRFPSILFAALLCTASIAAHAQQTTEGPRSTQQTVEARATITSIDKASRTIGLKLEDGSSSSLVAPPEMQRFDELAVGDKVHARYTLGVTTELRAPTEVEKQEPFFVVEGGARASNEAAPAAGAGRMIRVVATIEALDRTNGTATLKGPNGNYMTVNVAEPELLTKPRLGDWVVVTVAESVAISLEKATPAK